MIIFVKYKKNRATENVLKRVKFTFLIFFSIHSGIYVMLTLRKTITKTL